MPSRRSVASALLRLPLLFSPLPWMPSTACAAAASVDGVTIRFDAAPSPGGDRAAGDPNRVGDWSEIPEFAAYERWAHVEDPARQIYPAVSAAGSVACVGATDSKGRAGLEIVNLTDSVIQLRIETRLPPGLWRADAAVLRKSPGTRMLGSPPSLWRMESLLRSDTGTVAKRIPLAANEALFLRWTETAASAAERRQAVRRTCWTTADSALQDRVSGALTPVDDILDAMPILIGRGDRPKITRRIHTALLATAKAQALWDNGRGGSLNDRDTSFSDLVTALSEISCACFNLVPSETIVTPTDGGKAEIRIGVTNCGTRTIPLVTLGIDSTDAHTPGGSDRTVYRAVAPGATVVARFPVADPTLARGIVQFISDMGAATVAADPDSPPPLASANN